MYLERLRIRHFRNLGSQELELPEAGVAIVGDNAQGKSNLLEAIHYLEAFRSFRGTPDRDLVAFGEEAFHVSCQLAEPGGNGARDTSRSLSAAYRRADGRKKVEVDGGEPPRLSDALGQVATVVLCPADTELVAGPPAVRRRFLDILLSLNEPGYVTQLQRYRRVLEQRNAALKEEGPEGARAWEEGLVWSGAEILRARVSWIAASAAVYEELHRRISGGPEGGLRYRPSVEPGEDLEDTVEEFRRRIRDGSAMEERTRTTMVGPHRDELLLTVPGREDTVPLRTFGSGGQMRTAALALRLTEADTVRRRRGRNPIVLLDDLFAELDAGRSERVLELLNESESGQVVVTAPREEDLRVGGPGLARWTIRAGRVTA